MNEKWIEGIKRNDEMPMLDQYFPGEEKSKHKSGKGVTDL